MSSGILKMFWKLCRTLDHEAATSLDRQHLDPAAGRLDLRPAASLTACARTVSACATSPSPRTLTRAPAGALDAAGARRAPSGSTTLPAAKPAQRLDVDDGVLASCPRRAGSRAWGAAGRAASARPRTRALAAARARALWPLCALARRSCRGPSPGRGRPACAASWRRGAGRSSSSFMGHRRATCGTRLAIMPRIVGVSSWATSCRIRRSPSALTVASWLGLQPDHAPRQCDLKLLAWHRRSSAVAAVAAAPPRRVQS